LESPQLATDLLLDGHYQPLFASDVWALGQLGLGLAGGKQPEKRVRLQDSREYLQELEQGTNDLTSSPGHKACGVYLVDLAQNKAAVNYGSQVSLAHVQCKLP
jgi:hypothetical protein